MKRSERCADCCLIAEARGAQFACEKACAYAGEDVRDDIADADDLAFEAWFNDR